MKKQYPNAVVLRKRLVFIAAGGLLAMISLIIYNLWRDDNHPQAPTLNNKAVHDFAGEADTAWYKDTPTRMMPAVKQPLYVQPIPRSLINSTGPMVEFDLKAMQAPINSNQIKIEIALPTDVNKASLVRETGKDNDSDHQEENKNFLTHSQQNQNDYLGEEIKNPLSLYEIKTGAIIPATLISGINSDLPGPITAQVRENIYDTRAGRYVLIPQGARLQGIYDSSIVFGQQRVLIVWQRIIFPNGDSLKIVAMPGTDVSGYAGFKDQINNHIMRLFGSAVMMSLISAGVQLSQPQDANNNNQPSINQTLAQNLGISLSQTADMLLRKNINVQPTLTIRPGYLFNVTLTQDIKFPSPYRID